MLLLLLVMLMGTRRHLVFRSPAATEESELLESVTQMKFQEVEPWKGKTYRFTFLVETFHKLFPPRAAVGSCVCNTCAIYVKDDNDNNNNQCKRPLLHNISLYRLHTPEWLCPSRCSTDSNWNYR